MQREYETFLGRPKPETRFELVIFALQGQRINQLCYSGFDVLVVHQRYVVLYILCIVNRTHKTSLNVGWTSQKASTESSGRVGEMTSTPERVLRESVDEIIWTCERDDLPHPRETSHKSSTESFGRVREMTSTPERDISEIVDGIIWTCGRDDFFTVPYIQHNAP